MSRGFVLSLAVMLMALAVLGLGLTVKPAIANAQQGKLYAVAIEGVVYRHDNIEDNIIDMLENIGGVLMRLEGNRVKISEWLPDWGNKRKDTYVVSVDAYKKFIAMFPDGVDTNIAVDDVNLTMVVIGDINYLHTGMSRNRKSENEVRIEADETVREFSIEVWPQTGDLKDSYASCPPAPGGSLDLVVTIYPKTAPKATLGCYDLGMDSYAEIWVDAEGAANKDINVVFDSGVLMITNEKSVPIYLTTTLELSGEARFGLAEGIITVANQKYGAVKR